MSPTVRRAVTVLTATLALSGLVACQTAQVTPATPSPATPPPAAAATTAPPPTAAAAPTAAASPAAAKPTAVPKDQLATSISMGQSSLFANLDPHFSVGLSTGSTFRGAFDTLVLPDKDGQMVAGVAREWRSINPTTWEFTLRDGVRFADGTPLDANAVKFNVDRVTRPGGASPGAAAFFVTFEGAQVVSPSVVRITTKAPDPILPNRTAALYLVATDYPATAGEAPYADKTNGSGPYQSREIRPSTSYEAQLNPASWRAANATLQTFRIVALPEGATLLAALRAGDLDIGYNPPLEQARALGEAGFDIKTGAAASTVRVAFNIVDEPEGSPLRNPLVRQAMNYAIDKAALQQAAYGGFGRIADGQIIGPSAFGYNPTLRPYDFNQARARELLAQAGYPNGIDMTVSFTPGFRPFAEPIQGMLTSAGIRTQLEAMEPAIVVQRFNAGTMPPAFIGSSDWFPLFDPDTLYLRQSNMVPPAAQVWDNARFNALYDQSTRELDRNRREALLREAAAVMREDAPFIFLVQQESVYPVRRTVLGFEVRADAAVMFDQISKLR